MAEEGANVAVISRNAHAAAAAFDDLAAMHRVRIICLSADGAQSGSVEAGPRMRSVRCRAWPSPTTGWAHPAILSPSTIPSGNNIFRTR
ncbi:hypothetical protein [Sphingopyxis panaciterrulae]|uniref:hypothetical protein n=1 Tax=Sphingopyxis panaciterrulae TaxID=462372 RepID=UPI0023EF4A25|nr:hypothetical protein [Sphingopyxis panaciterrulae]